MHFAASITLLLLSLLASPALAHWRLVLFEGRELEMSEGEPWSWPPSFEGEDEDDDDDDESSLEEDRLWLEESGVDLSYERGDLDCTPMTSHSNNGMFLSARLTQIAGEPDDACSATFYRDVGSCEQKLPTFRRIGPPGVGQSQTFIEPGGPTPSQSAPIHRGSGLPTAENEVSDDAPGFNCFRVDCFEPNASVRHPAEDIYD